MVTTRPQDPIPERTSTGGAIVSRVVAAVVCAAMTGFVLLGIGFGRSTACTNEYSCSGTMCDPCRAITLTLAVAHLVNLGVCGLVIWLVLGRRGRGGSIAAQVLALVALVVVVIYLTSRGVVWG